MCDKKLIKALQSSGSRLPVGRSIHALCPSEDATRPRFCLGIAAVLMMAADGNKASHTL
jgi:hypothetical protein